MIVAGMVLERRWNERRMVNEELNWRREMGCFIGAERETSLSGFDFVGKKSVAPANRNPCHQTS